MVKLRDRPREMGMMPFNSFPAKTTTFSAGHWPKLGNVPFNLFPIPTIVPRRVMLLMDDGNGPEKSLLENMKVTRRGMPVPSDG